MKGPQRSLTQADAAVIGGNSLVRPKLQSRFSNLCLQIFDQQIILKNTTRENDHVHVVSGRQRPDRICDAVSHSTLK